MFRRVATCQVAILAFALASCGGVARTVPPSSPSPLLKRPLPSFRRAALDGQTFDTDKQGSQVMVIKFFAQYCVPCQRTLPAAEKVHREFSDVVFVGISEDEFASAASQQVARYQLTFPVIHDAANVLAGRFRVADMPMTFVSDRTGQIVWVGGSDQDPDQLVHALEALPR